MGCNQHMVCAANLCPSNAECMGHQDECDSNQTTNWTDGPILPGGTRIRAVHWTELQTAINNERTDITPPLGRRGAASTSTACTSNTPGMYAFTPGVSAGSHIKALHQQEIANAINTTPFNVSGDIEGPGAPASNVNPGDQIVQSDVNTLRNLINIVEKNCICDNYCSCNYDCPCNVDNVCVCNVDIY